MSDFVHLHVHSEYSLLDGANRIDQLVAKAKEFSMPAVALTDHGNLFGAIWFYEECRKRNIKPIIGMEGYFTTSSRFTRDKRSKIYHILLLAASEVGFRNIIKISSKAFTEGYYYKPRLDFDLLEKYNEGIICLSACLQGVLQQNIVSKRIDEAKREIKRFLDIFGRERFFIELMDHGLAVQKEVNEVLYSLAKQFGIRVVATNDAHYLDKVDAKAHDVLLCIGTQSYIYEEDRLRFETDQFYFKSPSEMKSVFASFPEAIENTLVVAEMCNVRIPEGRFFLPDFPVPEGYDLNSYLKKIAYEGLEARLRFLKEHNLMIYDEEVYWKRLNDELKIITDMGFSGYFLIVWDFVKYARSKNIPVGPGRGSAAGSLVSYALYITDIDPLRYGLLFERFLNPERVSLPDIDIDFCMRRRGEVIKYVQDKYGEDKVSQIITFGTLAARAVIRDVGRVLGFSYQEVDKIAKLIPPMSRSLGAVVEEVPGISELIKKDEKVKEIFDIGMKLEGLTRHASLHAAGIVITPTSVDELVPLYRSSKGEIATQWDKDVIERLGILKMDFLGLKTLTVIDDCVQMLRKKGKEVDIASIPLDDPEVYRLFSEGRTAGVFQFESAGMRDLLLMTNPDKFEDLAALNALYRPGALSEAMPITYARRKKGEEKVDYILPETKEILSETYGVIVYQEQVMQIAVKIAGFSMGEADILRKAMGKKQPEIMEKQREKFIEGGVKQGFPRHKVEELWRYIEPFAGYGFNKSHSVAYALLAYQTAYLKVHYPLEFMAALITSEMGSSDNVFKYLKEALSMGIKILPASINDSSWEFVVNDEDNGIRFGLGAIKGVGSAAASIVIEEREKNGLYQNFIDFVNRVYPEVNRKTVEALVKAGCFDQFGINRKSLLESLPELLEAVERNKKILRSRKRLLFTMDSIVQELPIKKVDMDERELLSMEKESFGFFLSGDPLGEYSYFIQAVTSCDTASLQEKYVNSTVSLGGVTGKVVRGKIKTGVNKGKVKAHFKLYDKYGAVNVQVFPSELEKFDSFLKEGEIVVVKGVVRERGGEREIIASEIVPIKELLEKPVAKMVIFTTGDKLDAVYDSFLNIIKSNKGNTNLEVVITVNGDVYTVFTKGIEWSIDLGKAITACLGDRSYRLVYE